MLTPRQLRYLKELLEGHAELGWRAWFARNEPELRERLSRAAFLRLKFEPFEQAERHLRDAGVDFTPDPDALRRERHHASFAAELLDERGRVREEHRRAAHDGAIGLALDGRLDEARAVLTRNVARGSLQDIIDLCWDGEVELTLGDPAVGRLMLEVVAALDSGDDQLDVPVLRARELLASSES